MTKQELKQILISVRNGAFITPILERIYTEMSTEEKFKIEASKLDNIFDAFDIFYSKMDKVFKEREVSLDEIAIITEIKEIINTLQEGKNNKGYLSWNGDDLTRAEYKLAVLMSNLGEITSEKVKRSNSMFRWVKFRKFEAWNPAKAKLEKELKDKKRITKDEIEAEISKEIFAESMMEAFMSSHTDYLTTMFDSTKSILTSLSHRINLLREERQISRKQ